MRAAALAPVAALALTACATATFHISPREQLEAEEAANLEDMARAAAEGLQGTWLTSEWRGAACRWSKKDPTVAVCRTATRRNDLQPWRPSTQRYRRTEAGRWRLAAD